MVFPAGPTSDVAAGVNSSEAVSGATASEVSAAVPERELAATIPTTAVSAAMATHQVVTAFPGSSEFVQVTEIGLPLMTGNLLDSIYFQKSLIILCF